MSGPIVRKYGFPNFEKIFGERPLEHGVDDEEDSEAKTKNAVGAKAPTKKPKAKASSRKKPKAK
jgi:hypothetical protein